MLVPKPDTPRGEDSTETKSPGSKVLTAHDIHAIRTETLQPGRSRPSFKLSRAIAMASSWFPLPVRFKAKLRYASRFSLNPGAGTLAVHVFSANGTYDPDITGVGHQPKGWDQLIALYDHFVVTHARIRVDLAPGLGSMIFGVNVSGSNTVTYTDPQDYLELPHCSHAVTDNVVTYGSPRTPSLTQSVDIGKFLGVQDLMDGREFASDNSANATEDVAFHVWAASTDGAYDPSALYGLAVVEYEGWFVEPRDPASS
jgi:hypothetical protein